MNSTDDIQLCTHEMRQYLKIQLSEINCEKNLHASRILYEQEIARQLRVAIVLLEEHNDRLQSQLSHEKWHVTELEKTAQSMRNTAGTTEIELGDIKSRLAIKSREAESLKAELESLQGVSVDSAKLLTEKYALSHELANLKPEIEHLRSQAITHQTLFAEKLSLQRQLTTTQVELETEKRMTQRTLAKEGERHEHDEHLESQLEELRSELAKERKEGQKLQHEAQRLSIDFEGRKSVLESRLDAFRHKLSITKDQLKETQKELQNSRGLVREQQEHTAIVRPANQKSKKRNISQLDVDSTVGTLGIVPLTRKDKRGSTVVGEKSTFSITPYLNRSTSMAPASPVERQPILGNISLVDPEHISTADKSVPVTGVEAVKDLVIEGDNQKSSTEAMALSSNMVLDIKSGHSNPKKEPSYKRYLKMGLEQVREEGDASGYQIPLEMQALDAEPIAAGIAAKNVENTLGEETTFIKKKRKLLGASATRTLFDDEEGESQRIGAQGRRGNARGLDMSVKAGLATNHGARAHLENLHAKFGTFSPLKKERRPVGIAISNM